MHKLKKIISMLTVFCLVSGPLMASDPKATAIRTTTSSFNNNLSTADTTVQAALDTIDNISLGSGAPTSATYITQTANGTLSNEQALGSLATGIVKNTTTTGVLSIAASGTDYVAPAGNVATATALAANGSNCSSGSAPLGVDASGAVESCFDVGTQTEVDLKAPLASPTFTGTVTLPASTALVTPAIGAATGTSLALSGAIGQVGGSTGATISAASGVVTIGGIGNSRNENLLFDFEGNANIVALSSTTGVATINYATLSQKTSDDTNIVLGNSTDVGLQYDGAETNDSLKLGLTVGSSAQSGVFLITELADIDTNFGVPSVSNPTLRIQSSDAATTSDWIGFAHDQSRARIWSGDGLLGIGGISKTNNEDLLLDFETNANTVTVTSGTGVTTLAVNIPQTTDGNIQRSSKTTDAGWAVVAGANTACNTTCTSACVVGFDQGTLGAVVGSIVACTDATADQCLCAGAS